MFLERIDIPNIQLWIKVLTNCCNIHISKSKWFIGTSKLAIYEILWKKLQQVSHKRIIYSKSDYECYDLGILLISIEIKTNKASRSNNRYIDLCANIQCYLLFTTLETNNKLIQLPKHFSITLCKIDYN